MCLQVILHLCRKNSCCSSWDVVWILSLHWKCFCTACADDRVGAKVYKVTCLLSSQNWAAPAALAPAVTPNYPGMLWCSSGSVGPSPCSPLPSQLWFTGFTLHRKAHWNTERTAQGVVVLRKTLFVLMGCAFFLSSGIDWDDFRWRRRKAAFLANFQQSVLGIYPTNHGGSKLVNEKANSSRKRSSVIPQQVLWTVGGLTREQTTRL